MVRKNNLVELKKWADKAKKNGVIRSVYDCYDLTGPEPVLTGCKRKIDMVDLSNEGPEDRPQSSAVAIIEDVSMDLSAEFSAELSGKLSAMEDEFPNLTILSRAATMVSSTSNTSNSAMVVDLTTADSRASEIPKPVIDLTNGNVTGPLPTTPTNGTFVFNNAENVTIVLGNELNPHAGIIRSLFPRLNHPTSKRNSYTFKQKNACIDIYDYFVGKQWNESSSLSPADRKRLNRFYCKALAERVIRRYPGYSHVTIKMVESWKLRKVMRRRGPKVNREFERDLLNELIITEVSSTEDYVEVLANGCFSYDVIRASANLLKATPKYSSDPLIKDLKFSEGWIHNFLTRQRLLRKRCTSTDKPKPSADIVSQWLDRLQQKIDKEKITPERIFNEDETGIRWCEPLLYQYVLENADRSTTPEGDDSGRFTALLGSNALGKMLPLFQVLKCSCKDPLDLTKSTILRTMLIDGTLSPLEWSLEVHECELLRGGQIITSKRPYLIRKDTLEIITVQNSAWNDATTMLLHVEKQLKPFKARHFPDKKCLMVVDGVSSHKVPEVQAAYADAGWILEYFPPNMTDELQPMDLAVNAVCKSAMRKLRIEKMLDKIRQFKADLFSYYHNRPHKPKPIFVPPYPSYRDGVKAMLRLMNTTFSQKSFSESVERVFKRVGLAPDASPDGRQIWMKYQRSARKGSLFNGNREPNNLASLLTECESRSTLTIPPSAVSDPVTYEYHHDGDIDEIDEEEAIESVVDTPEFLAMTAEANDRY